MNKILIRLLGAIIVIQTGFSLTGCANAALAVTDPRSLGTVSSDQYITRALQVKYSSSDFESSTVYVTVYNNNALLTGAAKSIWQRHKIVETAQKEGVNRIWDYLEINPKYETSSSNDSYITAKVKTDLFSSSNINSNDVKIVTTSGVVYILGIIDKSQENNMLKVTRNVSGVKKVVPLVSYKDSDSKLNLTSDN